jgi:DUF4097 and DUF4098 domain-containing protein YvlB
MSESYPATDTSTLRTVRLELRRGNVDITGGADALHVETDPADALRQYFEVSAEGDTLRVKQPPLWTGMPERYTLKLSLPATVTDVSCTTGHGDVAIRSLRAALSARTGHGDVAIESGGGVLEAHTGKGDIATTVWDGPARLATGSGDVTVEVVSGDVSVSTGRGDVSIVTGGGRVTASTGHGDITVGKLSGDVTISTGHGDITATELEGARLNLTTGRGDVSLGGRLGGLRARSGAGDFDIRCTLLAGEFEANTGHGCLTVHLPADTSARLDISTRRGRIDSDLPLVKVGLPGPGGHFSKRYVVNVGGERPRSSVKLRTNHGDIRVFGSGEGASVTYDAATYPSATFEPAMGIAGEAIASAMRTATTATERAWEETMRQMRGRFGADFMSPAAPAPPPPPVWPGTPPRRSDGEPASPVDPPTPPTAEAPVAQAPASAATDGAADGPAAEPASPAQPSAANSRLAILEAVSAGKISVDEGLALLSRLESEGRR